MGMFADFDLASVDEDPNSFPDGTYRGFVFDARLVQYKDTAKGQALVLTYKIADESQKGKTIDEWKSANAFDDSSKKAWLKVRLLSLGIPETRLATVDTEDLIGTEIFFTKKKKGDYNNVTFVRLADGSDVADTKTESVSDLL